MHEYYYHSLQVVKVRSVAQLRGPEGPLPEKKEKEKRQGKTKRGMESDWGVLHAVPTFMF